MKPLKYIVIHPDDNTTKFLHKIYYNKGYDKYTQYDSHSLVYDAIKSADVIIMLGHGSDKGLFGTTGRGDKLVIDSRMVKALRDKICIGIWCHADDFAKKYKLKGLFSGMVISDIDEAIDYCISITGNDLVSEMDMYANVLRDSIDTMDLKDIPAALRKIGGSNIPIRKFNYNSLYYFD